MNSWQLLNEIRNVLRDLQWTDTTNQVFGGEAVVVTVAPEAEAGTAIRFPAVLIRPLDAGVDPDHGQQHDLLRQRIGIRIFNAVAGDALGETPLIGGFWTSGADQSEGRGLLEIEEEVFNAIQELSLDDGVEIDFRASGAAQAVMIEEVGYIVFRDYEFESWVTANRDYPPPREFSATVLSTGAVSMTWVNPATGRYDFRRMRLRRASGSTPPTATSGTAVNLSSDTATSHVEIPGSGTFSYAIFAAYDDRQDPPATDREFSDGDSATVVVP